MTKLLKSKDRLVRTATYVAALRSGNARLTSLAESSFEEEVDRSVRRHVALRVPRLLPSQTREDS